mmetsp:Transcript_33108/g.69952  ORF Transcript_33108/g.69952 Transcript_33108/m.69952 type:complete len:241 (+) Transcript_33108:65-787(+)|eukprot:CAMPEP_0204258070 /NCGR_PEP_ID=MMETSP0468-20130131/4791_1 /ASSEMBLY_ACC=CAM_ASM_000383 /TAXON_ID=2969 /ORGANISM="Oxyrrhis marina" /LENGTH=240 /DNA_ID=CAMNT_0051232245 /DNA_START=64 /DNA_END=786 /DNA_ORIENTATION=+
MRPPMQSMMRPPMQMQPMQPMQMQQGMYQQPMFQQQQMYQQPGARPDLEMQRLMGGGGQQPPRLQRSGTTQALAATGKSDPCSLVLEGIVLIYLLWAMFDVGWGSKLLDPTWQATATPADIALYSPLCSNLFQYIFLMFLIQILKVVIMISAQYCRPEFLILSGLVRGLGGLVGAVWGLILAFNGWEKQTGKCSESLVTVSQLFAYLAVISFVILILVLCCFTVFVSAAVARGGSSDAEE